MKQKVTITLTIEPRDYKRRGTAKEAVGIARAILQGVADLPPNQRIRLASGKAVSYLTRVV